MALSWLRPPAITAAEVVSAGVGTGAWWQKCCHHLSFEQLRVTRSPCGEKEGIKFH